MSPVPSPSADIRMEQLKTLLLQQQNKTNEETKTPPPSPPRSNAKRKKISTSAEKNSPLVLTQRRDEVWKQNDQAVRLNMLMDPIFFDFMLRLYKQRLCDDDKEQKVAHEMVHFFFNVVLHSKEKTTSNSKNDDDWSQVLCHWFSQSPENAEFLLNYVLSSNQFLEMAIVSTDTEVSGIVLAMLLRVVKYVSPESVSKLLSVCLSAEAFETAQENWYSFDNFFLFLSKLAKRYREDMLRRGVVGLLCAFLLGGREISTKSKLKSWNSILSDLSADTKLRPNFSVVVGAIENLVLIREDDTLRIEDKMLSGWCGPMLDDASFRIVNSFYEFPDLAETIASRIVRRCVDAKDSSELCVRLLST